MKHGITDRARRVPRPLAAFLVLLVLAAPLLRSVPPTAARATDEAPLDLAALALTPADLAAEGLEGYGIADGDSRSPAAVAAGFAFQRGLPEDVARALFAGTGLVQAYELRLDLPAGSGNDAAASVTSTIHEYADEDGAAAAFAILTDSGDGEAVEAIQTDETIGDASILTRQRGTTPEPFHAIDLTFRFGNLTAVVRLVDLEGNEPAAADAERLAARLLERIEAGPEERAGGIAAMALRLTGEGAVPGGDFYAVRDGESRPTFGQSAEDAAANAEEQAEANLTDEYVLRQTITTTSLPGDIYYYSVVQRFADEEAASAFLRGTPDRQAEREGFAGFEEIEGLAAFGDEAIAFTQSYHWAANDLDLVYQSYHLRAGDRLALIDLIAAEALPPAALAELAAAQAACLEAGGCAEPRPLPADLQSLAEDPVFGRPETDGRMADAALPDERSWTDPRGDVELTYDPAAWEVVPEELWAGDEILMLVEDGGQSVLTLSVSAGAGDAEACVEDRLASVAAAEAHGAARPVTDGTGESIAGGDAERAYGAYGVRLDNGAQNFMYVECRAFADGESTLLISHGGPLDRYEARGSARETLLDGLVLAAD